MTTNHCTEDGCALPSRVAPDFSLPELSGRLHRLSDLRGRRVLLLTWASWCGCRSDLPMWQALHAETKSRPFTILAVALDEADAARPWIEAANPEFPCLIDAEHRIAELFGFTNVPQAVGIDETGRIVRGPEAAGMSDAFRSMNRTTFELPEAAQQERQRVKRQYVEAVREWANRDATISIAYEHFRRGQALLREGRADDATKAFAEATRLHPESWAMWRQTAQKKATGLAVGDAFWARVDALGDRPYYAPVTLQKAPAFTLTSEDMQNGAPLAEAQRAGNISPQLTWSNVPEGTKSFAVTVFDADAPTPSGFWHWAVMGIPADVRSLVRNASATSLPEGATQLPNDARLPQFIGAAPPKGHGVHRYFIVVHALDVDTLPVPKDGTPAYLSFTMHGHTLGRATLIATAETP